MWKSPCVNSGKETVSTFKVVYLCANILEFVCLYV